MPFKVTAHTSIPDFMSVAAQSHFANCVQQIFQEARPSLIIETGTFDGTGTTAIIGNAIRQFQIADAQFFTIECYPGHHAAAVQNTRAMNLNVRPLLGLSVPRQLLPSDEQLRKDLIDSEIDGVFVDHDPEQRVQRYQAETNFPLVPDDLLGKCLQHFNYRPHFLLLDSAGHMGNIEFNYVVPLLRGQCFFALDDTNHVKHYRSVQQMKQDPRFRIIIESQEKFGFCFAEFNP